MIKSKIFLFFTTGTTLIIAGMAALFCINPLVDEPGRYALLIGGGTSVQNHFESYYHNIAYVNDALKQMGYDDDKIRILFFEGHTAAHPLVEGAATKQNVISELRRFEHILDSNDSLLIFRSGHGLIELVFDQYGILSNDDRIPEGRPVNVTGSAAVMCFPDGSLSHTDFRLELERIQARQIVVILNQCYSGQFTDIAGHIANTVVISETAELGFAFISKRWGHHVWPFVKCLFDGYLQNSRNGMRTTYEAYEFMLGCNPNVAGIAARADRPLLKASPQIRYGAGLKKGTVCIASNKD
jgi:hypothetical protein